jgi:hypothetical protein
MGETQMVEEHEEEETAQNRGRRVHSHWSLACCEAKPPDQMLRVIGTDADRVNRFRV